MPSEASKPPTPPAAFRSALLFPEDANLKAYATPDSPSENPLNQGRATPPPAAVDDATAKPEVPPDERPYTAGYKAGYAEGFAAGHAAGLRAAAAASNTASTSGWRVLTQPTDGGGAPPPPAGAYVFHCSSETEAECLDRRLLGCSYAMRGKVRARRPLIRVAGGLVSRRVDAIDASGRVCHRFIRAGRGNRERHAPRALQHQVAPRYWQFHGDGAAAAQHREGRVRREV